MPSLEPTVFQLIIGTLLMAAGALLQASVGFGIALFVVPPLILLNPAFVPGPMLFASLFLAGIMAIRGREVVAPQKLGLAVAGLFLGTAAGALSLLVIAADKWPKLFAVLILSAVALSASGIHIPVTRRNLAVAGILSGVMGTISGIHGPPMALLYQREAGNVVRANLAAFFALAYAIALFALGIVGLFGKKELLIGLALAPGVIAGFLLARFCTRLLDQGCWLRIAILTVASLSAIALILRK
jgi:uncharacterized membrane protein YfcA